MDLRPYVEAVRAELTLAAEAGGDDARALAERLTAPLESALRLALLDALSEAADEITRELAPGSVDVRLRQREPTFVVTPPPAEAPSAPAPPPVTDTEDDTTVRISLRLPENLKSRVERAAARAGISINTWLIRTASAAVETPPSSPTPGVGQRYTGWVR